MIAGSFLNLNPNPNLNLNRMGIRIKIMTKIGVTALLLAVRFPAALNVQSHE